MPVGYVICTLRHTLSPITMGYGVRRIICIYTYFAGCFYHCSFYYIGLWSASWSGMSKVKAPAFLFLFTIIAARSHRHLAGKWMR